MDDQGKHIATVAQMGLCVWGFVIATFCALLAILMVLSGQVGLADWRPISLFSFAGAFATVGSLGLALLRRKSKR